MQNSGFIEMNLAQNPLLNTNKLFFTFQFLIISFSQYYYLKHYVSLFKMLYKKFFKTKNKINYWSQKIISSKETKSNN